MSTPQRSRVSILIPAFNEEDNVVPMYEALCQAAAADPDTDFEFLFIDDGSTDRTFERLEALHDADPRVKAVRLSRNFGSHIGVCVALEYASGAAGIIMPCDLQDHPREIHRFLEKWREGYQVVWGARASRQDRSLDVFFSKLFAWFVRKVCMPHYPANGTGSFCLMDRKVMDALRRYPERNRMTFGLILNTGFRQVFIPYDRDRRNRGASKYSLERKIKLFVDVLVSFSYAPIRLATWTGLTLAALSILYTLYIGLYKILYGIPVAGWTTLLVAILLLGGVQLMFLGILGEYLWRILDDVRRRPLYHVWETVGAVAQRGEPCPPVAGGNRP